ncbi:hypothetical protein K1719_036964 [Acacia pycnantha]|nr:hypothetical protein K1719_036964 [Acacia pycnantha]
MSGTNRNDRHGIVKEENDRPTSFTESLWLRTAIRRRRRIIERRQRSRETERRDIDAVKKKKVVNSARIVVLESFLFGLYVGEAILHHFLRTAHYCLILSPFLEDDRQRGDPIPMEETKRWIQSFHVRFRLVIVGQYGFCGKHGELSPVLLWGDAL